MNKHKRPSGPTYKVTAEWQREVKRRLDERGWNQLRLSREIKSDPVISPSAIYAVMKPAAAGTTSRLVPIINRTLGMSEPIRDLSPDEEEVVGVLRTLAKSEPAHYRSILVMIRAFIKERV